MTASPTPNGIPKSKSTFLTIVASLLIAGSALSTFSTLIGVGALIAAPDAASRVMARFARDSSLRHSLPSPSVYAVHHYYLAAALKLLFWNAALCTSVGLVLRKEWARQLMIGLLALGVVVTAYREYAGLSLMRALRERLGWTQFPRNVAASITLGLLVTVGVIGVLFALMLWLRSTKVRAECAPRERAA